MRTIIQRVNGSFVEVNNKIIGKINKGLLVLVGVEADDKQSDIAWLAKKIINLRIFPDENNKMNLSVNDINGEILIISQFTLFASTKKGNRPSYQRAAPPKISFDLYQQFIEEMKKYGLKIETGEFGADMNINLTNTGPVTIYIDTKQKE